MSLPGEVPDAGVRCLYPADPLNPPYPPIPAPLPRHKRPKVSPMIDLLRGHSEPPSQPDAISARVQVFPAPQGIVLVVGMTVTGEWVCEVRCLAEDFGEEDILKVEQRVLKREQKNAKASSLHLLR